MATNGTSRARRGNGLSAAIVSIAAILSACDDAAEIPGTDPGSEVPDGAAAPSSRDASTSANRRDAGATSADASASAPPGMPEIEPGAPIEAADGEWVRVPIPEGNCRHGGDAYMMVHLNSASSKVAIYEEGGGACWNDLSCSLLNFNPPSYLAEAGIFALDREDNPLRDWNLFYIPYCTGDVHAGANPSVDVGPVTGTTAYRGYGNMKLYLARILGTVPDATDYLVAGSSAGGFGVGLSTDLIASNAPASVARFTMLDDSGPPLGEEVIPVCLQQQWRTTWGFDQSFLPACGDECPGTAGFISDYVRYLTHKYDTYRGEGWFVGGLISSTEDAVMRLFFGFGANDCSGAPVSVAKADYTAALLALRETVSQQTSRFGTFFFEGNLHTTLMSSRKATVAGVGLGGLYDTEADGVKLVDWVVDLIDRRVVSHVGP